jgi:hypothetical protein
LVGQLSRWNTSCHAHREPGSPEHIRVQLRTAAVWIPCSHRFGERGRGLARVFENRGKVTMLGVESG